MLACSHHAVTNVLAREPRPPGPADWNPSPARLRVTSERRSEPGSSAGRPTRRSPARSDGGVNGLARSGANGGRDGYKAWHAHQEAGQRARRPKAPRLAHAPLAAAVTEWPEWWWSPEQIANRLRLEFPDDPMMWVSHETIDQSLFVEGRGELRGELRRCLRTGRARRRPRSRIETRGQIPDKVMITDRPAEAEDRAVSGHWEVT